MQVVYGARVRQGVGDLSHEHSLIALSCLTCPDRELVMCMGLAHWWHLGVLGCRNGHLDRCRGSSGRVCCIVQLDLGHPQFENRRWVL